MHAPGSSNTCIEPVSGNEARTIIKSLKHSKAPGYDAVINSIIKQLPCHCINHLVTIYNGALRLQHFPESWKKSGSGHNSQEREGPTNPSESLTAWSPQMSREGI